MKHKLDIFRLLEDGQFLWVKSVEGLEEARMQLNLLKKINPGEYFIYDVHSSRRVE